MDTPTLPSRRAFLKGAIPTIAVTALGPSSLAIAAAVETPTENPALLSLVGELQSAVDRHAEALALKLAAVERYEALAPALPDLLILKDGSRLRDGTRAFSCFGERQMDVEDNIVWDAPGIARYVVDAYLMSEELTFRDGRTVIGRRLRKMLSTAKKYEAGIADAKKQSGVAAAIDALYSAEDHLAQVAEAIAKTPARTTEGLIEKARAVVVREAITGSNWAKPDFREVRLANDLLAILLN